MPESFQIRPQQGRYFRGSAKPKACRFGALIAALVACIAIAPAAQAEALGDASRGRDLAVEICAGCHAVVAETAKSPKPEAPPFKDIAALPSTTRTALTVWFRTPHPTMPNLILEANDSDDLIAYILGLREGS